MSCLVENLIERDRKYLIQVLREDNIEIKNKLDDLLCNFEQYLESTIANKNGQKKKPVQADIIESNEEKLSTTLVSRQVVPEAATSNGKNCHLIYTFWLLN